MLSMATGTVKTVLAEKGFGFISPDGGDGSRGSEVFFHHSAVQDGQIETYREGDRVSFTSEPDPRDPSRTRAADVRRITE
jgi:cold shock protein